MFKNDDNDNVLVDAVGSAATDAVVHSFYDIGRKRYSEFKFALKIEYNGKLLKAML